MPIHLTPNYLESDFLAKGLKLLQTMSQTFKVFLRDKNVASIAASSLHTVKKVCNFIDFKKDSIFIEYGPGSGVFTRYILNHATPKSKLIAIETNRYFCNTLATADSRLTIINDSAENIKKILNTYKVKYANYIISGIPFSKFDNRLKDKIIKNSYDILPLGGKFLLYQISKDIKKYLEQYFIVESYYQILNIPPLFIFEAVK